MAAPTAGTLRWVTPAGMGFTDRGQAATDLAAGDLLVIATTTPNTGFEKVWQKAPISTVEPDGVAIAACKAGEPVDVGIQGEMEGYQGMTPKTLFYSSATVVGGIDSTAVTNAAIRMKAVSATRIRYCFV